MVLSNQAEETPGCLVVPGAGQMVVNAIVVVAVEIEINKSDILELLVSSFRKCTKFCAMCIGGLPATRRSRSRAAPARERRLPRAGRAAPRKGGAHRTAVCATGPSRRSTPCGCHCVSRGNPHGAADGVRDTSERARRAVEPHDTLCIPSPSRRPSGPGALHGPRARGACLRARRTRRRSSPPSCAIGKSLLARGSVGASRQDRGRNH